MPWRILLASLVLVVLWAPEAPAQSLIGSYFRCSADEGEADFIMRQVFAETYQKRVKAGDLTAWGWVQHVAGGPWRRILTITAPDRARAWRVWGEITQELQKDHPNALHRFNEICSSHDDYIWTITANAAGTDPNATPAAWVSTYWQCNEATESRADEIIKELSGVYDSQVKAGRLTGWTWYTHDMGGPFRRLLVLAGKDHPSVLDARQAAIDELMKNHSKLIAEFSSICSGHTDYAWSSLLPAVQ